MDKTEQFNLIQDLEFSISNFKHRHYTNPSSKRMQKEIIEKLEEIKRRIEEVQER
jgi:hypothetical protein